MVGLCADSLDKSENASEASLEELEALLQTAGGECMGTVLQNRKTPDPGTFIGYGKVEEVRAMAEAGDCSLVVFDNELSPTQTRVLEKQLGVRVIDRSALILDIFADRATSSEGRLQVALAQYQYLLPRLTGMWTHLTSQTAAGGRGPIGTRGPGETQLETDRRHIRRKIQKLEAELAAVQKVRGTQRRLREKNHVPVVALVGYTNAGKSTLLNSLTGAGIHTGNRLFDTLDTTTRRLSISPTMEVLLSDTVGFIRKLPHHLIDAFKATLEELRYADLLLHVVDASNPDWEEQYQVVEKLIRELDAWQTPRIDVLNKADRFAGVILPRGENIVSVSALTGQGLDTLLSRMAALLDDSRQVKLRLPYDRAGLLEMLHRDGGVQRVDYQDDCIEVDVVLRPDAWGRVKEFAVTE